ncbi:MAG: hypothetical protein WA708_17575 [Acidobacteriaceae bacterium]
MTASRYPLAVYFLLYDLSMPPKKAITLRLSAAQVRDLEALQRKLNLNETSVLRLALTRLAEQELLKPAPGTKLQ